MRVTVQRIVVIGAVATAMVGSFAHASGKKGEHATQSNKGIQDGTVPPSPTTATGSARSSGAVPIGELIPIALKRVHILRNPRTGIWDKRADFSTTTGEKFLVFQKLSELQGQSLYYQYKPLTRKMFSDSAAGAAQVQLLDAQIRRNGGKPENRIALRMVAGDEETAKQADKKKWLEDVCQYFGLRPSTTVVLFSDNSTANAIYAVNKGNVWHFFDMQGSVQEDITFVNAP